MVIDLCESCTRAVVGCVGLGVKPNRGFVPKSGKCY